MGKTRSSRLRIVCQIVTPESRRRNADFGPQRQLGLPHVDGPLGGLSSYHGPWPWSCYGDRSWACEKASSHWTIKDSCTERQVGSTGDPAGGLVSRRQATATIVSDSPGSPNRHEGVIAMTPNRKPDHDRLIAAAFGSTVLLSAVSTQAQDFQFDASISRQVLDNYLNRSISFAELLHDDLDQPRNRRGVDPRDNVRLILSSRAKFVGRAILVWGRERSLPNFLRMAKPYAAALHKADPELILQGTAFEIVTPGVESIPIPEKVFAEFGVPYQKRNFRYQDMLYADGRFVNYWDRIGSVPDMSRLETRMWFYFLAQSYVDAGIEAIHFGRVALMDKNDPFHVHWIDMLERIRAYARKHARRHYLLCDAPCPTGAYVGRESCCSIFSLLRWELRRCLTGRIKASSKPAIRTRDA